MKNIILTVSIVVLALFSSVAPVSAQTQTPGGAPPLDYSGFVKCDGVKKVGEPGRQTECNFIRLMETVIKTINWMFYIAIPLATLILAYGGFLYMTGDPGKIKDARKMFGAVAVGFIIMVSAWILIRTAVNWIVEDPTATTFIK